MSTAKLTVKQQRFVNFYDGNGVAAARNAGYKGDDNTLASVSKENLRKPHIAAELKLRENKRNGKHIATRLERQIFWTKMMKAEKDSDKLKASELLGRSYADFTDNTNVNLNFEKELAELE